MRDVAVEARRRASAARPWASLPSTTAVGPVKSTSVVGRAAARRWRPAAAGRADRARRAPPPRTTLPTPRRPRDPEDRAGRRPNDLGIVRVDRSADRAGLPPRPTPRRCAAACRGCPGSPTRRRATTHEPVGREHVAARRRASRATASTGCGVRVVPTFSSTPSFSSVDSGCRRPRAARDSGANATSAPGPRYTRSSARAAVERGVDRARPFDHEGPLRARGPAGRAAARGAA